MRSVTSFVWSRAYSFSIKNKSFNLIDPLHVKENKTYKNKDVHFFDVSWHRPDTGRNGEKEWLEKPRIPGSKFWDIDKIATKTADNLPHMLPSPNDWSKALSSFGVKPDDLVIVYDSVGCFSAPRLWWQFKVFGHNRVHVLNGGLRKWQQIGGELETGTPRSLSETKSSNYPEKPINKAWIADLEEVLKISKELTRKPEKTNILFLDARIEARFTGSVEEPRPGLIPGHVPGAKNLPYTDILNVEGDMLPSAEIKKKLETKGLLPDKKDVNILTSCASGITACIIGLAYHNLGYNIKVYDGSWTEYGNASKNLPIAKGPV